MIVKKQTNVITVRKSNHKCLKSIKDENETYNNIITRLLDHWDQTHQKDAELPISPIKKHRGYGNEWAIHNINLQEDTKNRLKKLGKMDNTYDDLITALLDHWNQTHEKKKEN